MAEKIDLIVTSDALKGLDSLIAKLNEADKALNDLANGGMDAGKKIANINSPSAFNAFMQSTTKLNQQLSEQSTIVTKLSSETTKLSRSKEAIAKAAEKERLAEIKLQQAREKAFDSYEKEAKKLTAAQNLYNKTQQQLNTVQAAYNNLATKKERYNNLSEQEEKRLKTLQTVTEKYNTVLKGVDATVGKHTRNVGNYASGFNALSGSINQLTREAPAFANSVQTGFMAISNNLPIFFDAISNTQKEIKALRAEGQEVPGLFKQLTSSIFSWGTALSVGVTLLTMYGPQLADWAVSLFSASKGIDSVAESQKQLSEAQTEGMKNAVEEQVNVKMLLETAKDANLSYKERAIAVDKLQEQYPFYFENLSTEQIMAGDTAKAERELNDAILARAKSQAAVSKITENQSKIIDIEIEQDKVRLKLDSEKKLLNSRLLDDSQRSTDQTRTRIASAKGEIKLYQEQFNSLEKQKVALNNVNASLTKFATVNEKAAIGLDYHTVKEKKLKEAKKEHEKLNFSIMESEYALQEAILQGQKAEIQARLQNPELKLDERIKIREEFTKKNIELIVFQNEKEKALIQERYNEDLEKNKLALKNKELTQKEFEQNRLTLNKRFTNEIGLNEIKLSTDINLIREEDYKFLKDIEDKKRDYTIETQKLIYKGFSDAEKSIADNEKLSLVRRQEAFEKQQEWDLKIIKLEYEKALAQSKSVEETELINQKYADQLNAIKRLESPTKKAIEQADQFFNSFQSDFFAKSGLSKLHEFFLTFDKDGKSYFDNLKEALKSTGQEWAAYFTLISESSQEVMNKLFEMNNTNFENEKTRLETQKDLAIKYAGDSTAAKKKIEDEYNEKQKAIQNRENKAKQKQAMFNIAIDTAQAIMSIWAHSPDPTGISQGTLTAIITGIGLAQIGLVAAQKIPQYWMGGEHGGGLMMVNDGKGPNYQETIVTPDGKVIKPEGRNVIMDAPAGTQIFTHDQWNSQLKNMLAGKGIEMRNNSNAAIDYNRFDDIMGKHLGNRTSQHINFDRNGFSAYISRNGNITRRSEDRGSGIGLKV